MPRNFIKRYLPDHEKIRSHKSLRVFGNLLHDPNLWHLNRRSAAGAFAVGLFMAFVPVPFQMALAAGAAIAVRVNLPVSVALVWITNPFTMPPIFYLAYRFGAWMLGGEIAVAGFDWASPELLLELAGIWQPFLLGCLVLGLASALLGYTLIRGLWRLRLVRHAQRKKLERNLREQT